MKDVHPMNIRFAKVMEIVTIFGLVVMILTSLAYFAGANQFLGPEESLKHWDKPASEFWEATREIEISGYSWFLRNLRYMDCLSVIGIAILAIAPLLSIIAAIPKSGRVYVILLTVLAVEFIVAVSIPLFMDTAWL